MAAGADRPARPSVKGVTRHSNDIEYGEHNVSRGLAGLIHKRDGRDDDAMEDFKRSARLGSNFATMLLAQFNPYAAMCNKMLKNVFEVRTLRAHFVAVENECSQNVMFDVSLKTFISSKEK